jgi:guanylate kinase
LRGKPFIIVGPSGVGKNTLVQAILKKYEGIFEKKVSYTTRLEKKQNYQLISREEFEKVSFLSIYLIDF